MSRSNKIFVIPNILSIIRLLMIPAIVYFIVLNRPFIILTLYLLALGTDMLDGFIARKYNQLTKVGYYLDAVADNTLNGVMVVTFSVNGNFPIYAMFLWMVIFISAAIGFFSAPKKEIFYKAFKKGRMREIGSILLLACMLAGTFRFAYVDWVIIFTAMVFSVCASIYIFNVFKLKKEYEAQFKS